MHAYFIQKVFRSLVAHSCHVKNFLQNGIKSFFTSQFYAQYSMITMWKMFAWNSCTSIKNKKQKSNLCITNHSPCHDIQNLSQVHLISSCGVDTLPFSGHGLKFGGARYHSYCYKLCCEPLQSKLEHMKPTELHHLQKAKIKFWGLLSPGYGYPSYSQNTPHRIPRKLQLNAFSNSTKHM